MENKKYHTVGTVPKSNTYTWMVKELKYIV
jgi:hypothetical protein